MFKKIAGKIVAVAPLAAALPAMAAPPVLTTLTDSVDFSTTSAAILVVSAALIVVYITWKAAKMVIGAVRGA